MRPRLPRPPTGESPARAAARSPDRPEWSELSPQTWAVGSTPHAPHPQSPSRFQILVSFRGRPNLSPLHGFPNSPLQSRLSNPCLYFLVLASLASPPCQVRAPRPPHTPAPASLPQSTGGWAGRGRSWNQPDRSAGARGRRAWEPARGAGRGPRGHALPDVGGGRCAVLSAQSSTSAPGELSWLPSLA